MKRKQNLEELLCALVATMVACGMDTERETARAVNTQASESAGEENGQDEHVPKGILTHTVGPAATDPCDPGVSDQTPCIATGLNDHVTWVDTSARGNQKLLVFMPGHGIPPKSYGLVQMEAARAGYHVVGLAFANGTAALAVACRVADPNACFRDSRLEMLDGTPREHSVVHPGVPKSIYNLLPKLLQYLGKYYPEEGWSRFLRHGEPKWSRIAVGGHSLGGGQAALIAKSHLVARVVLFSAVPDSFSSTAASAPWVSTDVTPANRYWGLAHQREPLFMPIHASWGLLGMTAFGGDKFPENMEPPYDFTHMLVTNLAPHLPSQVPPLTPMGSDFHLSIARDDRTPLGPDGTPSLTDAWRYLLTAQAGGDDEDRKDDSAEDR